MAHINPHCPECGTELSGPNSAVPQAMKVEYRTPTEHPRSEPPPVDAIFCPSCGRLLTPMPHPRAG